MAAKKTLDFLSNGVPTFARSQLLNNKAWIGGQWMSEGQGKTYPVINPANGQLITHVTDVGIEETKLAITEAYTAQKKWARQTAKERSGVLRKWYDMMIKYKDDLAKIITLEEGKPLVESLAEVAYGASFVEWFAEEGKRIYGDIIPSTVNDRRILVLKQPVGVAVLITPWNFPIAMVTRKAGAALAAGCSVILKPSEETPMSALAIAELSDEAGIPRGVFNVLPCSRETTPTIGQCLINDDRITKLSFTGSTATGKRLMASCSESVKRISLELGGNAPFIVFNSADIPVAVRGAMAAKFRNSGQTCICPNRFMVQNKVYDQFVDELSKQVAALKIGNGFDEDTQQGPLINETAVKKVEHHVSDAQLKGSEVLVGGVRVTEATGSFYQPSVLVNIKENMIMNNEETFGPVAAITKFDEEDEAVTIANATQYGLIGYFYSQDVSQICRVAESLEYGMIGSNESILSTEVAPFGGIKQSGLGREGSKYGLDEYLNIKYLCLGNLN